jgi:hypothetical protein
LYGANELSTAAAWHEGHDVERELKEIGKGYLRPTFITLQMVSHSLPHAFIMLPIFFSRSLTHSTLSRENSKNSPKLFAGILNF